MLKYALLEQKIAMNLCDNFTSRTMAQMAHFSIYAIVLAGVLYIPYGEKVNVWPPYSTTVEDCSCWQDSGYAEPVTPFDE